MLPHERQVRLKCLIFFRKSAAMLHGGKLYWCPGKDSNLHGLHRWYLKPVRLPIPPPGPGRGNKSGERRCQRPDDSLRDRNIAASFARKRRLSAAAPVATRGAGDRHYGADGGARTRTIMDREILSLLRLPVSPRPHASLSCHRRAGLKIPPQPRTSSLAIGGWKVRPISQGK